MPELDLSTVNPHTRKVHRLLKLLEDINASSDGKKGIIFVKQVQCSQVGSCIDVFMHRYTLPMPDI